MRSPLLPVFNQLAFWTILTGVCSAIFFDWTVLIFAVIGLFVILAVFAGADMSYLTTSSKPQEVKQVKRKKTPIYRMDHIKYRDAT